MIPLRSSGKQLPSPQLHPEPCRQGAEQRAVQNAAGFEVATGLVSAAAGTRHRAFPLLPVEAVDGRDFPSGLSAPGQDCLTRAPASVRSRCCRLRSRAVPRQRSPWKDAPERARRADPAAAFADGRRTDPKGRTAAPNHGFPPVGPAHRVPDGCKQVAEEGPVPRPGRRQNQRVTARTLGSSGILQRYARVDCSPLRAPTRGGPIFLLPDVATGFSNSWDSAPVWLTEFFSRWKRWPERTSAAGCGPCPGPCGRGRVHRMRSSRSIRPAGCQR